jgi:hypothetical protein
MGFYGKNAAVVFTIYFDLSADFAMAKEVD